MKRGVFPVILILFMTSTVLALERLPPPLPVLESPLPTDSPLPTPTSEIIETTIEVTLRPVVGHGLSPLPTSTPMPFHYYLPFVSFDVFRPTPTPPVPTATPRPTPQLQ